MVTLTPFLSCMDVDISSIFNEAYHCVVMASCMQLQCAEESADRENNKIVAEYLTQATLANDYGNKYIHIHY